MNEDIQALSKNILALRRSHHLTQSQLAQIMGISPGTLRKLENGILPSRLSVAAILRLCGYFGIVPASLFL